MVFPWALGCLTIAGDTAGKRQRAVDCAIFAGDILERPVSDRGALGVTQFAVFPLEWKRQSLILNGEMSEWLKEHAWKAILAKPTEQHWNTSPRNRCSELAP